MNYLEYIDYVYIKESLLKIVARKDLIIDRDISLPIVRNREISNNISKYIDDIGIENIDGKNIYFCTKHNVCNVYFNAGKEIEINDAFLLCALRSNARIGKTLAYQKYGFSTINYDKTCESICNLMGIPYVKGIIDLLTTEDDKINFLINLLDTKKENNINELDAGNLL